VLAAAAVFLAVTLGLCGAYLALTGHFQAHASRVRRRMAEEFVKEQPKEALSPLYKKLGQLKLDSERGDPLAAPTTRQSFAGPSVSGLLLHDRLSRLLDQANLAWTPQQLLLRAAALGFIGGGLTTWLGGLLVGLAAAAAAAALAYVHWRRQARRQRYLEQLPAAFELMARVIRAGQSVPQALQAVSEAFDDPLAGEFANCQKQQSLGLRPEVCFQELMERSGILEMRLFVMAMVIQRQSGGNLSEVLDRLAGLIRARLRLSRQVRTLTAEGRLQGWTLVVLPFLVFAAMMTINRSYAEVLLEHVGLLVAMAASMAIGILWIRRIVNFES
jgi:tight adherence protein B